MDTEYYEEDARIQWHEPHIYVPYWNSLANVTISRCPFTGQIHEQLLDTYSLIGSNNRYNNGVAVEFSPKGYHHSSHLFQVHCFIHLNGKRPNKRNLMDDVLHSSEPEIPFVTPSLLNSDTPTIAVIHSIPIMNIRGKTFKPAYTLYVISYYAENPEAVLKNRREEWARQHGTDYYWRVCDYWEILTGEHLNLAKWVEAGKLQWMTETNELSSDAEAFPYQDISGMNHGYRYSALTKTFTKVDTFIAAA